MPSGLYVANVILIPHNESTWNPSWESLDLMYEYDMHIIRMDAIWLRYWAITNFSGSFQKNAGKILKCFFVRKVTTITAIARLALVGKINCNNVKPSYVKTTGG